MLNDVDAVLAANYDFYTAFADRDYAAMEEVWAVDKDVACIHPGWPPLVGRESVMESWRRILDNDASPAVECLQPEAFFCGDAMIVVCYERLDENYLSATNIFVLENGLWKLVHHQAGPCATAPDETEDEVPHGTIH